MSHQSESLKNRRGTAEYTEDEKADIMTYIFSRIENGLSLFKAMEIPEGDGVRPIIAHNTMTKWISADASLMKEYTRVKTVRHDRLAEKVLTDAENEHISIKVVDTEKGTFTTTYDNTERSRLKMHAGQWYLSKVDPRRYGNQAEDSTGGHVEQPMFDDIG